MVKKGMKLHLSLLQQLLRSNRVVLGFCTLVHSLKKLRVVIQNTICDRPRENQAYCAKNDFGVKSTMAIYDV